LGYDLAKVFDPAEPIIFPKEIRQRLARVETPDWAKEALLESLNPILCQLIGPLVHVSSSFHSQFKGGEVAAVDHGGYPQDTDYMEVHGPYLLHQDFAGASFPTSPSMVTLWTALNTTNHWNLRLYPASHRLGLLCDSWLDLNDQNLEKLGQPIDIKARAGTAVLFNGLMLHGTSNPGPERRVSCDIRFFPLCGFLPSKVYSLNSTAADSIRKHLQNQPDVLTAPFWEDYVFLNHGAKTNEIPADVPPTSVLNWIRYLSHRLAGKNDDALPYLRRWVSEISTDAPEVYINKFHHYPFCTENLIKVREELGWINQ
jgi:hypothetical protein